MQLSHRKLFLTKNIFLWFHLVILIYDRSAQPSLWRLPFSFDSINKPYVLNIFLFLTQKLLLAILLEIRIMSYIVISMNVFASIMSQFIGYFFDCILLDMTMKYHNKCIVGPWWLILPHLILDLVTRA